VDAFKWLGWEGGVAHYLSRCGWPTSDRTFHTQTALYDCLPTFTSNTYIIVTMVLSILQVDSDEGSDASSELLGPSGTYPYILLAGSPAPALPVPTLDLWPYTTMMPALLLYLMTSASLFSGHLGHTPARVVGAPPLPSAVDGTAMVERIAGWSLKLDTIPLADRVYQTVEMMFYIGNSCYLNLSVHTVKEIRACRDISIVPNMAIPHVVWFAVM